MLMGGNMSATFLSVMSKRLSLHDISQRQYKEFKGKRYFGTYWPISGQPILTIRDLDLVQDVVGKQCGAAAYSDTLRKGQNCHCWQSVTVTSNFYYQIILFWGQKVSRQIYWVLLQI